MIRTALATALVLTLSSWGLWWLEEYHGPPQEIAAGSHDDVLNCHTSDCGTLGGSTSAQCFTVHGDESGYWEMCIPNAEPLILQDVRIEGRR